MFIWVKIQKGYKRINCEMSFPSFQSPPGTGIVTLLYKLQGYLMPIQAMWIISTKNKFSKDFLTEQFL